MSIVKCFRNFSYKHFSVAYYRMKSSVALDIEKLEQDTVDLEVVNEEAKQREEYIESKRNKSRLNEHHRNILHNKPPYKEPKFWTHGTLKYQRKMYGKYGEASGVNPQLCWPLKEEIELRQEYERVAYPYTISQIVEENQERQLQKEQQTRQRQEEIVKKVEKLDVWKKDLLSRIAKREADAQAIKDKKERLVEEVRRHFGYTVDPKDEKFKEMLEKKEKEEKKAMKEARKKAKEEKLLSKLQQINEKEKQEAE